MAASNFYPTVQNEVARIAASAEVRSAGEWFRLQESRFAEFQLDAARIAAPPFGEGPRAAWLVERFREIGLTEVETDKIGNVFGIHPGYGNRYVALSAHIDTVFPATTPLNVRQQGTRLYGPGVSDNGAGIPDYALPHVFERFYRADKARSRESGGAGLGLAIVKAICTAHGAELHVSSREGMGSVFTVELPLRDVPARDEARPAVRKI